MKKIAAGRAAFWEGGSLWVFDVPNAPDTPRRNAAHSHHAFQVTLALDGTFALHLPDRVLPGPAALVAPDAAHAIEVRGRVALLFVEPESRAGRSLGQLMSGAPGATIEPAEAQDSPELIARAFEDPRDPRAALAAAGMRICERIAGHVRTVEPDRRVRRMVAWAKENLAGPAGLASAAKAVGLSPSRASHLFVEETGLPFRTFLLWLRVTCAVDGYANGMSLTEAAQSAGFADSAHLSRTFRRMFGLAPASLLMS